MAPVAAVAILTRPTLGAPRRVLCPKLTRPTLGDCSPPARPTDCLAIDCPDAPFSQRGDGEHAFPMLPPSSLVLFPRIRRCVVAFLRLAMGAWPCGCGRHSHPPTTGAPRRSPGRSKFAEPSTDRTMRFHPSLSRRGPCILLIFKTNSPPAPNAPHDPVSRCQLFGRDSAVVPNIFRMSLDPWAKYSSAAPRRRSQAFQAASDSA